MYDLEVSLKKSKEADFVQSFVFELNRCRLNPEHYTYKILAHMKYIKQDYIGGEKIYYYKREREDKIMLLTGKEAFEKCIEVLKATEPLEPIEMKQELVIPVLEDPNLWTDQDYLKRKCSEKEEFNSGSDSKNSFHFDIGSANAEISLIMQLVDDTSFRGWRRNNLLSKEFKYIGIDNLNFDNTSCSYFYFASSLDEPIEY